MVSKTQTETFVSISSGIELEKIIDQTIDAIASDRMVAVAESVYNCFDAGASRVNIYVKKGLVAFEDDGCGMWGIQKPRMEAFFRFGKTELLMKKGINARALCGTGGKAEFAMYQQLLIETKSFLNEEKGTFAYGKVSVSYDQYKYKVITKEGAKVETSEFDFPFETGTRMTFSDAKPYKGLSEDMLVEKLASRLRTDYAEKVTVNGKKLNIRNPVGKYFKKIVIKDNAGEIAFNFYVPRKKTTEDVFRIDALGPVCLFNEFYGAMSPDQQAGFHHHIFHPNLCGSITINSLNEFATNNRTSFVSDLYTSTKGKKIIIDLKNAINFQIASDLNDLFGEVEESNEQEYEKKIFGAIKNLTDRTFGEPLIPGVGIKDKSPAKPSKVHHFEINIRRIELECGETVNFRITDLGISSGRFYWEDVDAGGMLNTTEGTSVVYTAGDIPGTYQLKVCDTEKVELFENATITLVKEKKFRLSPMTAEVECASEIALKTLNIENTSKSFSWQIVSGEGKLNKPTGTTNIFTAPEFSDTTVIKCYDQKIEKYTAITTIITRPPPEGPDSTLIKIGEAGEEVIFRPQVKTQTPVTEMYCCFPGKEIVDIHFFFGHPIISEAKNKSIEYSKNLLLTFLGMAYCELKHKEADPAKTAKIVAGILAKIAENK